MRPTGRTGASAPTILSCASCDAIDSISDFLKDISLSHEEVLAQDLATETCLPRDGEYVASQIIRGMVNASQPGSPCPDSAPCGPADCVPGVNLKCLVITVFGNGSTCEVAEVANYSAVGSYHAFAIGDDTCRLDSSGRSYYRLDVDLTATRSVAGLTGCADAACSVGCQVVAMTHANCSTPSWSHGLQLTVLAFLEDWAEKDVVLTPSPPSPSPPSPSPPPPSRSSSSRPARHRRARHRPLRLRLRPRRRHPRQTSRRQVRRRSSSL